MLFLLVSLFVPIATFIIMPWLTRRLGATSEKGIPYLVLACILFFVSWYLPSPLVFSQQTQATTHFIGGGIFTGLLWLYFKARFEWRRHLIKEAFSLYALVCTLGVSNELFELLVVRLGLSDLTLTDTSIDLMINTLGATVVFLIYALARAYHGRGHEIRGSR